MDIEKLTKYLEMYLADMESYDYRNILKAKAIIQDFIEYIKEIESNGDNI